MTEDHIFRVTFKEPPLADDERTDFFFHSLSAIYEVFTEQQIGCKVSRLWNIKLSHGATYDGRLCHITKEPISRKKRTNAAQKAETLRDNNLHANEMKR